MIQPLYMKEVTCTCCYRVFETKKVRIRQLKTEKIDSDFCTHFTSIDADPYRYYVYICPNCGYAFTDSFTKKLSSSQLETIDKVITSRWTKKDYGIERTPEIAIQAYKLSLFCATIIQEKQITIAGLCLRLAWLYRKLNHQSEEQHYLHYALQSYLSSYDNLDFKTSEMTEIKILYLIGDLSRQTKRYNQAIEFFSRVIKHPDNCHEQNIVEKARKQWYSTREQFEQEK